MHFRRMLTVDRRALLVSAGALAAGFVLFPILSPAQEGDSDAEPAVEPVAVATPPAGGGGIQPVGVGEVPTTGASRPGPNDVVQSRLAPAQVAPVGLAVEKAGIDAGIESLRVVDGAMPDPTGPWVVAWYENLGSLGRAGNIVMAGHIDYWNVGPSVFYNLATLAPGDEVVVAGDDGKTYPFTVEWVRQYDSVNMPLDEVAGPTEAQSLTLITCGGAFDYVNGQYLQRTVVRATRSGPGVAAEA
jgi:hypothetical protein